MYQVFKRKAYQETANGFTPDGGARKTRVCQVSSIDEARELCAQHNAKVPTKGTKGYYRFSWCEFTRADNY